MFDPYKVQDSRKKVRFQLENFISLPHLEPIYVTSLEASIDTIISESEVGFDARELELISTFLFKLAFYQSDSSIRKKERYLLDEKHRKEAEKFLQRLTINP